MQLTALPPSLSHLSDDIVLAKVREELPELDDGITSARLAELLGISRNDANWLLHRQSVMGNMEHGRAFNPDTRKPCGSAYFLTR
jgi:orotate phosphoribosyltransferase-like protein